MGFLRSRVGVGRLAACALALAAAAPADAKVFFTGYADLRANIDTHGTIRGTPATLTALSLTETDFVSHGFTSDAVGLFATTQVKEDLAFSLDLNFRNIGTSVGTFGVNYAYAEWQPYEAGTVRGGKLLVPFGYFNENRFYAFQRNTIAAPVFLSGILGLPISNWGAQYTHSFPTDAFTAELTAYSINGYGAVGTTGVNKQKLRTMTVAGGLAISGSLRASDNNHSPAVGGRARLTRIGGKDLETGVSYYYGMWDSGGLQPLQMENLHARANVWGFDVLAEGLMINAHGDQGFNDALGGPDWVTRGFFLSASHPLGAVRGKPLFVNGQTEYYRSHAINGSPLHETMRSWLGGLTLKASDNVTFKAEYLWFGYMLPDNKNAGNLSITANSTQASVVFSF